MGDAVGQYIGHNENVVILKGGDYALPSPTSVGYQ